MTNRLFVTGLATLALSLAPFLARPDSHAQGEPGGKAKEKTEAVESANPQWKEDSTRGQERAEERRSEQGAEQAGKKAKEEPKAGSEDAPE